MNTALRPLLTLCGVAIVSQAAMAQLAVTGTSPVLNANNVNRNSAISVTLLSSDIGKLYVALAQAIDRLRN